MVRTAGLLSMRHEPNPMTDSLALLPDQLRARCEPEAFAFETTDELPDLAEMIGQERALAAMRFGVGMPGPGYNLFVLGPDGAGKHTAASVFLEGQAAAEAVPDDWVYVSNFHDNRKPRPLRIPAGRGRQLQQDMQQWVEAMRKELPAMLEGDDYKARIARIDKEFSSRQEKAFRELHEQAQRDQIGIFRTQRGFTLAPIKDGKALDADAVQELPQDEQVRISSALERLEASLQDILQRQIPQWGKERQEQVKAVNEEMIEAAVDRLIEALREKYTDLPEVLTYIDEVRSDALSNIALFFNSDTTEQPTSAEGQELSLRRYQVNLFVDNGDRKGAPVVYEDNPTYSALLGRIEHISQLGTLVTDFTLIRAGALHKANGGYLIIDVRKLLLQPYSWEAIKRALSAGEVRIESLGQLLSLVSTVSLELDPIPLEVKVVLIGDRLLYYLLCEFDPDFLELFKVPADLEDTVDRRPENDQLYARLVATLARKHDLLPFDRGAVAAVIEQGMSLVGDREKLTTHMRRITDLLREASYWAAEAGQTVVRQEDVQRSIDHNVERIDRIRDRMHEAILRDTILIDTDGDSVAQVNGLSVIELAESAFGVPTRITATTRLGDGEVVDIEREVDLAGPIHSKGVFILSSYLAARYASDYPLSLNASLTFEQSYGQVEGDSASLAELCALLSSLSGLPIHQSLAVTGSVNQHGQVQAIGRINEKIEGFFSLCKERGLTGQQGVIMPASNMKHLMLRQGVVDAVAEGRFHVYAVEHVDEAIALLTGTKAGLVDAQGTFPVDTVNGRVQSRLRELVQLRMQYSAAGEHGLGGSVEQGQSPS